VEEEKELERSFRSKHGVGETTKWSSGGERKILGAVVPHAGYMYSGPIASHVYYELAKDGNPEGIVILGPNHYGIPGFSVMHEGTWRMPMGDVMVDAELATAIVNHSQFLDINPEAHRREHSIEVQLPFLQYIYNSNFKIVPITVGYSDHGMVKDVGIAIARAVRETTRDTIIIGSTDLTHYGETYGYAPVGMKPFEKVREWVYGVDASIINTITSLNAERLINIVNENKYTMCGSLPVATMLVATKELGAKKGKLLKYATSFDTQGSRDVIVGYASLVITR
jgi:AmmeMemoRadiSam system protein B